MTEKSEKEITLGGNQPIGWSKLHCVGCGRFLLEYAIVWGKVRVPCKSCKKTTTVSVTPEKDDQDEIEDSAARGDTYSPESIDKG